MEQNITLVEKMFRQKPIDAARKDSETITKLTRTLRVWDLIAFGISTTVGSGIFVIAGIAGQYAGGGLFISFLITGFACLLSGLAYAEFATRVPVSGSAYTYSYCAFGELVGFLIGWNLTLEYMISAAVTSQGYLQSFLETVGVDSKYLPNYLFGGTFKHKFGDTFDQYFTINIVSGVLIILCSILLIRGIKQSAMFTNFITLWNIVLIIFYVIAGSFYVNTDNWTHPCTASDQYNGSSCSSQDQNSIFPLGFRGLFHASGLIFFSYIGFDTVSCLAEETIDPMKNMARGIIGTLFIVMSLYVAVSLVLLGMIPFTALDQTSPLADAFSDHGQHTISCLVAVGAMTTTAATTLTSLLGQPRIFRRMAIDGLFFKPFQTLHPTFKTPIWGSVITGIFAFILGTFVNFELLANMISVGTLMAYNAVSAGVLILRYPKVEEDHIFNGNRFNLLIVLYTILSLGCGFIFDLIPSFQTPWLYLVIGSSILLVIVFACILFVTYTTTPNQPQNMFICPFTPWIPCAAILINSYMIASLKWDSFVRVAVWILIGACIYIFYGADHSKLNKMPLITNEICIDENDNDENDVENDFENDNTENNNPKISHHETVNDVKGRKNSNIAIYRSIDDNDI